MNKICGKLLMDLRSQSALFWLKVSYFMTPLFGKLANYGGSKKKDVINHWICLDVLKKGLDGITVIMSVQNQRINHHQSNYQHLQRGAKWFLKDFNSPFPGV